MSTPQNRKYTDEPGNNNQIFIAVGSNINPEKNIEEGLKLLTEKVQVIATSTFYRTKPVGRADVPAFYNGVWRLETDLSPMPLKQNLLRDIENRLGRKRTKDKYEPRVIDLDLILYEDKIIRTEHLTIPDPDIYIRPFVAVPLVELNPEIILPDTSTPLAQLESTKKRDDLQQLPAFTSLLKRIIDNE